MKQSLINMLTMQDRMNSRVHEHWVQQDFEWYRAIWIECGELIEHYGYKWWKKQEPDMEQVRLEIIDIWHFGMSALFCDGKDIEQIAAEIEVELQAIHSRRSGREGSHRSSCNALPADTGGFSPSHFWELMLSAGLNFDSSLHALCREECA